VPSKSNFMTCKIFIFALFLLFYTTTISAQHWIPRLNKNGTYSLVTEKGKLVNKVQYDYITPRWEGEKCAYWTSNGQAGCVFANKVSITFEPNKAYYQTQMIKPVMVKDKLGTSVLEDYVYLIAYSNNNLLVNIKTGKYVEDMPNNEDKQAIKMMPYFPVRDGLMKIHINEKWVNFVDLEFNRVFPNPIKKGEMVNPHLFIAQDTLTNRFGLMDVSGKTIVPYVYDKLILTPNENHLMVGIDTKKGVHPTRYKLGFIDLQGKLVLDTIHNEIRVFANNLYIIRTDGKSGVLNRNLEPIVPLDEQSIEPTNHYYQDKSKYLSISNRWGKRDPEGNLKVLDGNGNIVLQTDATNFHFQQECDCFYLEKQGGEKFVYNTINGIQFAFKDTFKDIFCPDGNQDKFYVRPKTDEFQVRSRNGDIIHTYPYNSVLPLNTITGFYKVYKDDKQGIIDSSGELIAPIQYDAIYDFYDSPIEGRNRNITGFKTGTVRQYGVYDKQSKKWKMFNTGEEAIKYLYPPEFKIIAGKSKQYGVVRRNGEVVIPAQYQTIQQIKDTPLFACYDINIQTWHIIGEKNNIVFTFDKAVAEIPPIANILKSTSDLAIQNGAGTLFLEKDTYKKRAYFDMIFVNGICVVSFENDGWVTMFKSNINIQTQKQVWVNYYTGKAYYEQ
jgi:hypothetical protein